MHPNDELATAIRRAADLLIERDLTEKARSVAFSHLNSAISMLEVCERRSLDARVDDFIEQMSNNETIGLERDEGSAFGFAESPYSGTANALAPPFFDYRRVGETIEARVVLGVAMEGRPGRAHGGATAAIFDDVMGAVQGLTGRHGYTRTLSISYFAPVPIDEEVLFVARFTGSEDRRFFVDAIATVEDRKLATAHGVFTEVPIEVFGQR